MTKLLLTSDIVYLDKNKYTFHIYDTESQKTYSMPYIKELDTDIDESVAGRPSWRPFGITKTLDHIYISNNSKIMKFNITDFSIDSILSDNGVINTHQIKNDGKFIYRSNTSNDTVSKIDIRTGEQIHFDFKTMKKIDDLVPPKHYKIQDEFHINSFHQFRTSLFVLANNLNKKRSELYVLDKSFDSCMKITDLGYHCHELIFDGRTIYTFSSGQGLMIELNFNDMTLDYMELEDPDKYFLRGATLNDGKIYVFANQLRKNFNKNSPVKLLTIDLDNDNILEEEIPEFGLICAVESL